MVMLQPFDDRLWSKIRRASKDECWIWTGRRTKGGYGSIYVRLAPGQYTNTTAHRAVYEEIHGPLLEGIEVLHRCDNPPCCNPGHLFEGTQRDNMRDMVIKGRQTIGDRSGEANAHCKISDAEVAEIRRLYSGGSISQMSLAAQFGLGQSQISRILRGENRTT